MDFTTTDENRANACQTSGQDTFSHDNITACEKYVLRIQRRLDKAVANDDKPKIRWYSHLLTKKSRAVKILAIHRVCEVNTGKHTAGVDGVSMPKRKNERLPIMMELLNAINIEKRPQPIRRVYIPKPNGDKRPLGIPTIADRINQDIIRQAIEPICEYHFQNCSYGFRPKRSCQDAMQSLFNKLSKPNSKRWIVEGDIKGCFDHIDHTHIISTLSDWQVSKPITTIIKGFLQADIMEETFSTPSTEGTPQGGIISPMLANVALTCLDEEIQSQYGRNGVNATNPIVRYADDFVIFARNETEANNMKDHIKGFLREKVGLTLSDEKTHISEISKGFDFLGFNFRKYGRKDTLLIKPTKESIKRVKQKLSETLLRFRDCEPDVLIRKITPITTGWANYYRHVVSRRAFTEIDAHIWTLLKRWILRKHRQGIRLWIKRYFKTGKNDRWIFYDPKTKTTLPKMAWTKIKRFIKVKSDMRVYDGNARQYWETREHHNARDAILGLGNLRKLYHVQIGRCAYCKQPITQQQVTGHSIETHHMRPRSEGGNGQPRNLRLIHSECHTTLHKQFPRNKMAEMIDKGIDYLRLLKPQKQS